MIAMRFGLSGNGSLRSVFGNTSASVSPGFHLRVISTYESGRESLVSVLPFTFTVKPVSAQ